MIAKINTREGVWLRNDFNIDKVLGTAQIFNPLWHEHMPGLG